MGKVFSIELPSYKKTKSSSTGEINSKESQSPSCDTLPTSTPTSSNGDGSLISSPMTTKSETRRPLPFARRPLLLPEFHGTSSRFKTNDPRRTRSASMGSLTLRRDKAAATPAPVSEQIDTMPFRQSTGELIKNAQQNKRRRRRQQQQQHRKRKSIASTFSDMCNRLNGRSRSRFSSDNEDIEGDNYDTLQNERDNTANKKTKTTPPLRGSKARRSRREVSNAWSSSNNSAFSSTSGTSSSSSGASSSEPFRPLAVNKLDNGILDEVDSLCQALKAIDNVRIATPSSPPPIQRAQSSLAFPGSKLNDFVYEFYKGNFGLKIGSDHASELDFQQRKHFLLRRVWGCFYQSNICKDPTLIVHWMCGSGHWEPAMARVFPQAKIIGVDYKPVPNGDNAPSNVEYRQLHPKPQSCGVHGLEKFAENSVDFLLIHDGWILGSQDNQWPKVLNQAFKILKPGGWFEIYDQDHPVTSGGPSFDQLEQWTVVLKRMFGTHTENAEYILDGLKAAGFANVSSKSVELPVGEWASTCKLQEIGYYMKDLRRRRFLIRAPGLKYANHITDSKLNHTLRKALKDCEIYRAHTTWYSLNAQKPL